MALHLFYREEGSSILTEADLTAEKISNVKLEVSYSHPARLTWIMHQAQHTKPIPDRADIIFLDDDFGDGSIYQPLFEGHVHEIQPSASNQVAYTAYDPTKRAGDEITILSGPSLFAAVIPRLVYNTKIETDDDYAFARELNATVGEMIADLLDDAFVQLDAMLAAPDQDSAGEDSVIAYVQSQLDAMDFEPQEKIVFETETLRSGLDRLLGMYPQYRMVFAPNPDRQWQFHKVIVSFDDSSSSTDGELRPPDVITLTLNKFTGDKNVLSMNLTRSLEQRKTAVEILGRPKLKLDIAAVSEGSDCSSRSSGSDIEDGCGLIEMWVAGDESVFITNGPGTNHTGNVSRVWRVANPVKRQLGRLLPEAIAAPVADPDIDSSNIFADVQNVLQASVSSRLPSLQCRFADDVAGVWKAVTGFKLDVNRGIITAPYHVYKVDSVSGDIELPEDVRFVYAHYDQSLTARHPTSGFEGTAFDVAGVETTLQIYDEDFVTGFEQNEEGVIVGEEVTEAARTAQFEKLARNLHEAYRDVIYTGGCTIQGIDYDFLRLNKLINITAVDGDGDPITTGWEDVRTVLTDVEYDYSQRLTTLTFSGDHLEFIQQDPDILKAMLKIRALQQLPEGLRIVFSGAGFESISSLIQ